MALFKIIPIMFQQKEILLTVINLIGNIISNYVKNLK